jgi:hypothetical protein
MSVGNLGAVKNLIDGWTWTSGTNVTPFLSADMNEGSAMFADAVRDVLARADFGSSLNAKIYAPTAGSASTYVTIEAASATNVVGVVLDNTFTSTLYFHLYDNATPTIGTTSALVDIAVPTVTQLPVVFMQPLVGATALTWAVTTTDYGNTQTNGAKLIAAVVYTK